MTDRTLRARRAVLGVMVLLLGLVTASACGGGDAASAGIETSDFWARASAGNVGENSAAYGLITNRQDEADRLIGARVPADIAGVVQLHTVVSDGDTMRMQQVEGWDVPADGGELALAPGGNHVMLMGLPARLEAGTTFTLTLVFERAGDVDVEVEVREASGQGGRETNMGGQGQGGQGADTGGGQVGQGTGGGN